MKKKVLLGLLALTMCITVFGCTKTPSKAANVTYEELKTSTTTAYEDVSSGKIEMNINMKMDSTAPKESREIFGDNTSISKEIDAIVTTVFDDNTIHIKIDFLGELAPMTSSQELYIDYTNKENAIMYVKEDDNVWYKQQNDINNLLSDLGLSLNDFEDLEGSNFDYIQNDAEVLLKDDKYVVSQTYLGSELFDVLNALSDGELEIYKSMIIEYLECISLNIINTYNENKILNKIDFNLNIENLNLNTDYSINASVDLKIEISELNSQIVDMPNDIIESAIEEEAIYEEEIFDLFY